jgi:hypothetical protein
LRYEGFKEIRMASSQSVWGLMEESDVLKDYPRPCFGKVPNFKGCEVAAKKVARLQEFLSARVVKVNPSLAQMHLRFELFPWTNQGILKGDVALYN